MARCTSWRFVGVNANPDDCLPVGKNRRLWAPCREKVPTRGGRCALCESSLVMCPSVPVRRALVNAPDVSAVTLRTLITDSNTGIALIAEQKLSDIENDDTLYDHLAKPNPFAELAPNQPSVWS